MIAMTPDEALLVVWCGTALLGVAAAGCALAWAIRSGQFRNQDRARYLPLRSGIPEGAPDEPASSRKQALPQKGQQP